MRLFRQLVDAIRTRRLLRYPRVVWTGADTIEFTKFMKTPTGFKIRAIVDDAIVNSTFSSSSDSEYRAGAIDIRNAMFSLVNEEALQTHEESDTPKDTD